MFFIGNFTCDPKGMISPAPLAPKIKKGCTPRCWYDFLGDQVPPKSKDPRGRGTIRPPKFEYKIKKSWAVHIKKVAKPPAPVAPAQNPGIAAYERSYRITECGGEKSTGSTTEQPRLC